MAASDRDKRRSRKFYRLSVLSFLQCEFESSSSCYENEQSQSEKALLPKAIAVYLTQSIFFAYLGIPGVEWVSERNKLNKQEL